VIEMDDITFQVGYPKTGSSYVCEKIFKKLNGYYVTSNININMDVEKYDKIIISNDGLVMCTIKNVDLENINWDKKRYVIADRIKNMFPDAKIIIGIREDKEKWKRSLYSEYIKCMGVKSYRRYISEHRIDEYIECDDYIKYLKSNFNNVLVYKLEELIEDHRLFSKKICDFLGCDIPNYYTDVLNKGLGDNLFRIRMYNIIDGFNKKYVGWDRHLYKDDGRVH